MGHIESAAVKLAVSAGLAAFVLYRLRSSNKPAAYWGLQPPAALGAAAAWIAVYLGWMLGTDLVTHWRGPWDFTAWREAPVAASVMRVMAVGVFGPIAEELVFRGFLFGLLKERIGLVATIAVTSFGWALLHFEYTWWVIAIIAVDGLLLGLARWRTGSVYVPIVMHVLYNLYAIW
jgi:membrane protease YdiL (CAAX protease family)